MPGEGAQQPMGPAFLNHLPFWRMQCKSCATNKYCILVTLKWWVLDFRLSAELHQSQVSLGWANLSAAGTGCLLQRRRPPRNPKSRVLGAWSSGWCQKGAPPSPVRLCFEPPRAREWSPRKSDILLSLPARSCDTEGLQRFNSSK